MPASRSGPRPKAKQPEYVENGPREERNKYAGPIIGADGKLKDGTSVSEATEEAQRAEDLSPRPPEQSQAEDNNSKTNKKD